jgi:glycine/D-amino acid oxidase-like deaminating enzyme
MSDKVFDVAIIGAGIVGAACAFECAKENLSIAIIEPNVIGGGATAECMGHIVVMDDSEAQFALTNYSQKLWREFSDELPKDNEYEECGTLWVACDDEEMQEVFRKEKFYKERDVEVEVLDANTLKEAEPNLRDGLIGALLVPCDGVVYPPCSAKFFVEKSGATIFQKRAVEVNDDGVKLNDDSFVKSKFVVNAAGCWSPELTEGLNVQRRKGHLVITDRYPNYVRHQLVELGYLKSAHSLTSDSVAFNIQPRKTGQMLIGSSRQYGSADKKVDNQILRRMLERAEWFMPSLKELIAIRVWTGFRPATPDKLPLIGRHPSRENFFLATGHEGLGITTSLGTARLLVDQILKRDSEIPIEPYLPR